LTLIIQAWLASFPDAEGAISGVEKLLQVAPDDMVWFAATSGAEELKPAFEKTILGRM